MLQAGYVYDGASDRLQQVDYTGASPITTTYTNDVFGLTQVLVADDGTAQVYNRPLPRRPPGEVSKKREKRNRKERQALSLTTMDLQGTPSPSIPTAAHHTD